MTSRTKRGGIHNFRHRVAICSARDVIEQGGTLAFSRVSAWEAWADIEESRGSMFSRDGYAIKEGRDKRSHKITIRYRQDVDISSAAWVYEERLKSPPRWFKVLSVADRDERGRFWVFEARLVERSEDVSRPVAPDADPAPTLGAAALPDGVKL